ncbi:MAG: hypothetical protein ABW061_25720, partial [Polyangiaceae bacterium]
MKTTLISLRLLFLILLGVFAQGCSSSSDAGPVASGAGSPGAGAVNGGAAGASAGSPAIAGAGGSTGGTGGSAAGTGGASAGSGGSAGGSGVPFVYFIKQANGTTTATLASGAISVANTFGASGNAFKYVAPNYYGTVSNGFIAFPTAMSGDFSIAAEVSITAQNKANNACGIGLGMTTGFNGSDSYAYVLMRNSNNTTNGYAVSAAGTLSAGAPSVPFTNGTALQLSFSRTGSNVTYGAGPVGAALTTSTAAAAALSNGTVAYGSAAVYPAISFNNV